MRLFVKVITASKTYIVVYNNSWLADGHHKEQNTHRIVKYEDSRTKKSKKKKNKRIQSNQSGSTEAIPELSKSEKSERKTRAYAKLYDQNDPTTRLVSRSPRLR
jgi:hypothetical protein